MTVSLKTNGKNRTKWRWRPVSSCWPPPLHFTPSSESGSNTTPPSLWFLHQIADQQKHPGAWRQSLALAPTTAAAVRTVPCLGCGINRGGMVSVVSGLPCGLSEITLYFQMRALHRLGWCHVKTAHKKEPTEAVMTWRRPDIRKYKQDLSSHHLLSFSL